MNVYSVVHIVLSISSEPLARDRCNGASIDGPCSSVDTFLRFQSRRCSVSFFILSKLLKAFVRLNLGYSNESKVNAIVVLSPANPREVHQAFAHATFFGRLLSPDVTRLEAGPRVLVLKLCFLHISVVYILNSELNSIFMPCLTREWPCCLHAVATRFKLRILMHSTLHSKCPRPWYG